MSGGKIAVLRIAGRVTQKKVLVETLNRLKLRKKFTCVLIEPKDKIRTGMVESAKDVVAYGKVTDEFVKELEKKRKAKNGVHFLHPPRGGFKKSSKIAAPKGILGRNENIVKLLERML